MPETWTGTPAEWDAERERKRKRVAQYFEGSSYATIDAVMSCMESLFPMPPRPVEPPYTCEQCGITDEDVYWSGRTNDKRYGHLTAEACREALKRELRALRAALAPRYEVCGWQVRRGLSETTTWSVASSFTADQCKELAAKHTEHFGGTAHAIYRRVEGKGCVVCGGEIAAVGSRYCESHTSHGGPCSTEAPRD